MTRELLAAGLGLVVGVVLSMIVALRRASGHRDGAVRAQAAEESARSEVRSLREQLERERDFFRQQVDGLGDRFQVLASQAMQEVVTRREHEQQATLAAREEKLDEQLRPLKDALESYRLRLDEEDKLRAVNYESLVQQTHQLRELQERSLHETTRLSAILGRSQERGSWAEQQLENILRLSGMLPYVDFVTQASVTTEDGRLRPDVIVSLPNGGRFPLDSKAPLAGYEAVLDATDEATRRSAEAAFAAQVRSHVTSLSSKQYQNLVQPAPDFTACFIPSDAVLATALRGDASLWTYATERKVLLVGPAALMGMLWSVAHGWRQADVRENADHVVALATELYDRTATMYGHFAKLGKALHDGVGAYNDTVGSLERNLLSTVRKMANSGIKGRKQLPDPPQLGELPHPLRKDAWPAAPALGGHVVDAEFFTDEEGRDLN